MYQGELIPHLFRTEYRKIVAVLVRHFGFSQIEVAEDLASDTFLAAVQTWPMEGIPANPVAWLYHVASNKARTWWRRNQIFAGKIAPSLKNEAQEEEGPEIDLSPRNINDSQLQMMFAVCHPAIGPEAQIGLALRILCGFGIDEIADAFLTNKENINKRLYRARERLREQKISIALPSPAEMETRLVPVLHTIYLLFNEGYYSSSRNPTLRKDLCYEAMRLCSMLLENSSTNKPEVNALQALMHFHASRFNARLGQDGELILYEDQDPGLWDSDLIGRGAYFLRASASGERISTYHLEASIAFWSTQKTDSREKWENLLDLHNHLLQLQYSPIAALNRAFILSKLRGSAAAIQEARKLDLDGNHFYHTLLGELYRDMNPQESMVQFGRALELARTENDRSLIRKKMQGPVR